MKPDVHYTVDASQQHTHLFKVTLQIDKPQAGQIVSLPVWIPGSYLVREFSKNLQNLKAKQGGKFVAVHQENKSQWQIESKPDLALQLSYEVYAFDNSVRTAWLDMQRGFFNGTSLCLRVHGQEELPHALTLLPFKNSDWTVATGLSPVKVNKQGFGEYLATNYDELVDCPFEMGNLWRGQFTACGIPHEFVVAGALPSFDGSRLLADTQKICETEINFWHDKKPKAQAPYKRYVFMLNAVEDGYGGLEHRNSTALICNRRDLPSIGMKKMPDAYVTLLGLISHEYFHTWNVKQLRPAEFKRYDYTQENYTQLLWFFEGFTSYYDDLLLRRAKLIDDSTYFKLLNKTINLVLQAPGRQVQSVAQASFDAWVKYYRQDENTPNATISYYTKGALVALCLDLSMRAEGTANLDQVMRGLWQRCQGGPMSETDLLAELEAQTGRSWKKEIKAWVHSTQELPLKTLLSSHGVVVHEDPPQMAQRLGLRVAETQGVVQIKAVLRGGAAEKAGMAAGDEWWAVASSKAKSTHWRLKKLEDLSLLLGTDKKAKATISRDQKVFELDLSMPSDVHTWRLSAAPAQGAAVSRTSAWLDGTAR
ncbi:M61 family metallopeptidase [Limnohabitans sp. Rim11]|uniref:M61 family metallopeptidase n=1 Tax=Limnohabitans sp. Rim11 TaxID=1100719 RepID=UPI000AD79350|nr:M61 family metallopeptidase [Limnohabitans sp. Rim11]